VRGGLLVAGVAIAVVGAGLMVSLFFLPAPPTDTQTTSVSIGELGSNATRTWTVTENTALSGTLSLAWDSSAPASVQLARAAACPVGTGLCPVKPAIVSWFGNLSGAWGYTGAVSSAYLLSVTNFGHTNLSFTGTVIETYVVPTPSQAVPAWALILLGGLVLLSIGAIATFLGLFLPSGVYRPPSGGIDEYDAGFDDRVGEFGPESPGSGGM
jgi:hypothetical protein